MRNLGNMMKQAQQMQQRLAEMQEKLGQTEIEGQAGGGMVKVVVTGKSEVRKVSIDKALIDPNEAEVLEDLIVAACNDARQKVEARTAEMMQQVTGGMNLPGGLKLPF